MKPIMKWFMLQNMPEYRRKKRGLSYCTMLRTTNFTFNNYCGHQKCVREVHETHTGFTVFATMYYSIPINDVTMRCTILKVFFVLFQLVSLIFCFDQYFIIGKMFKVNHVIYLY